MVSLSYGWKSTLLVLMATPLGSLWRAYALATLWAWFLVPLGLPVLGLAHAYGIAAFGSLAVTYVPALKDKDIVDADGMVKRDATAAERRLWISTRIGMMVAVPGIALLFGAVAHYLMGK